MKKGSVWIVQVLEKIMNPESTQGVGGSPGSSGCTISAMALKLNGERFTSDK